MKLDLHQVFSLPNTVQLLFNLCLPKTLQVGATWIVFKVEITCVLSMKHESLSAQRLGDIHSACKEVSL